MARHVGYCCKCKEKVDIVKATVSRTKNGRKMAKGACPNKCGVKSVCAFLAE